MKDERKNVVSGGHILSYLCLIFLLSFSACTDYEAQIDGDYDEWLAKQSSDDDEEAESSDSEKNAKASSSSSATNKDSGKSSSSSISVSSSSEKETVKSSSSAAPVEAVKGSTTDDRDNQNYTVVTIGEQTWMAQNLNYESDGSYCYGDKQENCAKHGRLYTWNAAQKACPSGMHLPSIDEWTKLFNVVGGEKFAGKSLKSSLGWDSRGNGSDEYYFSAYPAGARYEESLYLTEGSRAYFWSATEGEEGFAYNVYMTNDSDAVTLGLDSKNYARSVRCVKAK